MGRRKQCSEAEMLHEWFYRAEETMPSLKDETGGNEWMLAHSCTSRTPQMLIWVTVDDKLDCANSEFACFHMFCHC